MSLSLSVVFAIIGLVSLISAVIALVLLAYQASVIRDDLDTLGGRFSFEVTYSGGYSFVCLRLFEGDERDTQLSQALGLAGGLAPWRGPQGHYLRQLKVKHGVKVVAWQILFFHDPPPPLPMAPEMVLAQQLDHMETVLQGKLQDAGMMDREGIGKFIAWIHEVKEQRGALPVEKG